MKKFSKFVANNSLLILIICFVLLFPATIGFMKTKINYDILVYLPEEIETLKGEEILTDEFGIGSYAFIMTETKNNRAILNLEKEIKKISSVNQVFSILDVLDTTIPKSMLPDDILDKVYHGDETVIMVTFKDSISEDATIGAVEELRSIVTDANRVSSMTAMLIDTRNLSNSEMIAYIGIAVILCLIILTFATDSYLVPILLLSNIGVSILYNMGTNIFLGQISYITKAITAILQLGVTTDFSIFLYHKYEANKVICENNIKAMEIAIRETFTSVIGSSLTTFAGFLALCTMDLTLGIDIGIVMAKGVLFGLICVLTLFPALLIVFDKLICKTKHKNFFPKFKLLQKLSIKHNVLILIIFVILLIPAWIGNKNYEIYYKLDETLPDTLPFRIANSDLAKKYNIISPQIVILDKNINNLEVEKLTNDLKNIEGIDLVLAPNILMDDVTKNLLPDELTNLIDNSKYQLVLINSTYEVASINLNKQIKNINKVVKKYDKNGIVAGEGALMNDLVTIADHDFKAVNYTSIFVIFIIMIFVLKSISLPTILVLVIEFAIFVNMSVAYYTNTTLPFIASIIVGTIQLGATIDYAILMSTKYLEERSKLEDKKEAMRKTLYSTVPSVITSALCFFAATVGVFLYTKIDMIGSICELLSRGSIISMLVVILILPAMLMAFDKFIIKKEGRKNYEN